MYQFDKEEEKLKPNKGITELTPTARGIGLHLKIELEELACVRSAKEVIEVLLDSRYNDKQKLSHLDKQDKEYMLYMIKRLKGLLSKAELTFSSTNKNK